MTHILNITQDNPVIHLKAYGGVQIEGVDRTEVQCEIEAPQLATLVEEDGHVYITVNSACSLKVPVSSSIEIEKGMGSIKIAKINNRIQIEKALGNLVLMDVGEVIVEKVGGNFAVRNACGDVHVEKVGGNLVVDGVESLSCEKIGGNCNVKDVHDDFSLEKAGGGLQAQDIGGVMYVPRVGGSYALRNVRLGSDIRSGGDLVAKDFKIDGDALTLRAGGDIHMEIGGDFEGARFEIKSGSREIRVNYHQDDLDIGDEQFSYNIGETERKIEALSGGVVSLKELEDKEEDMVGDLSSYFSYEESTFSEMIQERVASATRMAEAKVKAAEIRLEKIRERVEMNRGFPLDVDVSDKGLPPVPSVTRPVGRKGASDEERLMILKMLQDKRITVDEAEALFKALED